MNLSRRQLLRTSGLLAASIPLSGCKLFDPWLATGHPVHDTLAGANDLTYKVQSWLRGDSLAPEYTQADIRQGSRANGTLDPQASDYLLLKAQNFRNYRLQVNGLVDKPLSLSGMIASKAGPVSPNGPARPCRWCWMPLAQNPRPILSFSAVLTVLVAVFPAPCPITNPSTCATPAIRKPSSPMA
jgi:hypothetical protein